jgi:hypothetical protein
VWNWNNTKQHEISSAFLVSVWRWARLSPTPLYKHKHTDIDTKGWRPAHFVPKSTPPLFFTTRRHVVHKKGRSRHGAGSTHFWRNHFDSLNSF